MRSAFLSSALIASIVVLSASRSVVQGQSLPPGVIPVRGSISSVASDSITVQSDQGPVVMHIMQPVTVYRQTPSDLKQVTTNTFVGITSEKGADGMERATEVHIFPEELRGMGEGSYIMSEAQSGSRIPSRMTNGPVSGSRATKGALPGSRMTNGTVSNSPTTSGTGAAKGSGVHLTIGNQEIDVPPGTPVSLMAATRDPLQQGDGVFVVAKKQTDGSLLATQIFASGAKK